MRRIVFALVLTSIGCGSAPGGAPGSSNDVPRLDLPGVNQQARFSAEDHTPGFFRDLYRVMSAQQLVDDTTAAERWLTEFLVRIETPGALPTLSPATKDTLDAALVLAVRGLQALATNPPAARSFAERMAERMLGLDPARVAWNDSHVNNQVPVTVVGSATIARAALDGIAKARFDAPLSCNQAAATATWEPNEPEQVWVPEDCESDVWVSGYCEPDRWEQGDCYDVWVAEACDGGYWRDDGRYEWICYGSDCRYEWRSRWTYVNGDCDDGYWEERCDADHWEPGLCYDGYYEDGYCIPGHYEEVYSGGDWSYEAITTPASCAEVRPAQYAIAVAGAQVLQAFLYDDLDGSWRIAIDALLDTQGIEIPNESGWAALLVLLENAGG